MILSDKALSEKKIAIPMLLCVGAVNKHLIKNRLRGYISINVQTGDALDTHSFATLIGVGATTVNPCCFRWYISTLQKNLLENIIRRMYRKIH